MPDKRKSKTGRKRAPSSLPIDVDRDELEELASLGCTQSEAASWFGCTEAEFKALLEDPELHLIWHRGKGRGRIRLRRAQFNLAEKNATMAILLGQRFLGQREEGDGDKSGHVTFVVDTGIARDGDE